MNRYQIYLTLFVAIISFPAVLLSNQQSDKPKNPIDNSINPVVIKSLEFRGFKVLCKVEHLKSPHLLNSTKTENIEDGLLQIAISAKIPDARKRAIKPLNSVLSNTLSNINSYYDTLMTEDFEEEEIDTTKWELKGNPTWE